jgi:hypothetical protein
MNTDMSRLKEEIFFSKLDYLPEYLPYPGKEISKLMFGSNAANVRF